MTYLDRAIKDGYAIITGPENKQKIIYVTSDNHTENYNDPEEKVRAEFWAELIYEYDYPAHRIKVEVTIPDRVPTDRADIVIFSDDECKKPYAVVECKRDGVTDAEFLQAIEQGVGNATWVKLRASYVVIIAGATRRVLDFSDDSTGILERENNIIADLPKAYSKELIQLYKEFYLRIVKKTRQVPVNIFTTNYDLYSENALDELGIMYNNGFLGSAQRIFNPNSYNYVVVENLGLSRDVWKSVSNFINLYKIHGSINWLKDDNSGSDTPHILEKDIELIRSRKKYDSIMIYPTPQKDRTTLMVPYSDLFRMMQNSLLKKNSVLISLGYSFGDEHINRIILNALSVYDFRLVIFGDSDMIRKLQEIGDNRIWIINSEDNIQ